ncbi:hypothetical protein MVLG_05348 [Microbotryum lychnidis-dioicae p1A1 Lamole]|uniref:glutamate--tRNA ligase n=1 Tax=Microbotryum lychnidis-dioicae (strain p1A1 Lamole / MvSl-1064) TaxID=683840 RepID=U5HDZ4_USTV1|nr:hypothetical protein MVLG_05348 [Microbotryum lychnidis-dioicae p1A1 Lamole]|eukprot:KDE04185.1 hypothetical protein MVLG_05348 [Microbotryum lychnidis-dioicae p1A1 Lamole]
MAATATLSLIAQLGKTAPQPFGVLATALALPSSSSNSVNIEWVHTLPEGADAVQLVVDGKITLGPIEAQHALANAFAPEGIFGSDKDESAQITALLLSLPPHPPVLPTALSLLSALERRLTLRTYLVGQTPTVADYAVWGHLRANPIALGVLAKPGVPHTARWYAHLTNLDPCQTAVSTIFQQAKVKAPSANKADDKKEDGANATFELGLPNVVKRHVITRFPPEPSGYLHIGHAKAAILNQYFARMYEGRFLIRFDDTNPSKEKAEFEESIIEDLALLGVKADATSYTSDYFDVLQRYCVQIIKQGNAYADDTEQEKMRDQRMNGVPSERRDASVEDNLAHFAEMATGSEEGRRWCIRAKISVDDPNKAMRDPVIYRCNLLPHHRTGTKYKMYPTYDFCCPIVDSLEGVTHALRTNEYRDRNPQYQWMLTTLGLRRVEVWDFGRLAFVYTLLSKRKLKWFVEEGHVRGWDDPRFATVRGIRRRGMTIEALTQFMLMQGPSQAFTNLEWDVFWSLNKKVIDPIAPRFTALKKKDLVKVKIIGGEGLPTKGPESKSMPKHKKNAEVGEKTTWFDSTIYVEQIDAITFAQDEEITLMDWGNAFVRSIERAGGAPEGKVETIEMELNLSGDFKKTKKKITWLASPSSNDGLQALTKVTLLDYDYLIFKKKMEEDDKFEDWLTPQTEFRTEAFADVNVAGLEKGTIIQFERKGFYIVDKAAKDGGEEGAELILIPDGKVSTVVSKHEATLNAAAAASKPRGGEDKAGKAKKEDKKAKGGEKKQKKVEAATTTTTTTATRCLPDLAPEEPKESILLSDGKEGFEQKVFTKMFKVPSVYGEDGVDAPATTKMFAVKPVYQQ